MNSTINITSSTTNRPYYHYIIVLVCIVFIFIGVIYIGYVASKAISMNFEPVKLPDANQPTNR